MQELLFEIMAILVGMFGMFCVGYFVGKDKGLDEGLEVAESWRQIALKIQEPEEDIEALNETQKALYNQSYGQPEVVDYLDQQYNSGRGVKE